MNDGCNEPDPRIEAYLDRHPRDHEVAGADPALAPDPELRGAVEQQRAIDNSIRRMFGDVLSRGIHPGESNGSMNGVLIAPRRVESLPVRAGEVNPRRHGFLAIAAALVAALSGGWLIWQALAPKPFAAGPYDQAWRSFETVYRDVLDAGFHPEWTCRDDREFADSFAVLYGQPLVLAPMPEGSRMLGLAYSHSLSPRTTCLLARVEEKPVLVFIDRAERDDPQAPSEASGLQLFRAEVGPLVLYELSPLNEPRVLQHLQSPPPGEAAPSAIETGGRS